MRITNYQQGDVVSVMFPNIEDPNLHTFRPAIIVEDYGETVRLVFMTKQLHQQSRYPKSFIITSDSDEGEKMGLTFDSLICPERDVEMRKIRIFPPPRGKCSELLIDEIMDLL